MPTLSHEHVIGQALPSLDAVILELGGQNPVIVDETADIGDAAKKIAWGKSAWGGQWCTSPGYVLVDESVADKFAEEAKKALKEMYGDDPKKSPDYSRIVSAKELQKLTAVIDPAKVIAGGDFDLEVLPSFLRTCLHRPLIGLIQDSGEKFPPIVSNCIKNFPPVLIFIVLFH